MDLFMMRRKLLLLLFILFAPLSIFAQTVIIQGGRSSNTASPTSQTPVRGRLLADSRPFFVPHWYIRAQGGMAYDVGEAKFSQLLSPGLQLSAGYQFTELFGARLSMTGFWARNRYAYPEVKYQWNFIQPTLEGELNLTSLILGKQPDRRWRSYAFAGVGAAFTFNNEDAVNGSERYGVLFEKLWRGSRWHFAAKAGLGVDYRITDEISLNAEVNGTMLPDHFNSKKGKRDNRDWHFNALVGVKFSLGKSFGKTEPVYERVMDEGSKRAVPPVEKVRFIVNIQFIINQSIIRANQLDKLGRLAEYLRKHPNAYVRLTGYADRDTGTPTINQRLSRERSAAVSKWLQNEGIAESRIRRFAKGDTVQPFDLPEDNRVTVCFVYNPDEDDDGKSYPY
jgi:outer membrane protein OmpA-like peptidoglycan-associated protein